jgi:hypothetical protein
MRQRDIVKRFSLDRHREQKMKEEPKMIMSCIIAILNIICKRLIKLWSRKMNQKPILNKEKVVLIMFLMRLVQIHLNTDQGLF